MMSRSLGFSTTFAAAAIAFPAIASAETAPESLNVVNGKPMVTKRSAYVVSTVVVTPEQYIAAQKLTGERDTISLKWEGTTLGGTKIWCADYRSLAGPGTLKAKCSFSSGGRRYLRRHSVTIDLVTSFGVESGDSGTAGFAEVATSTASVKFRRTR